MASYGTLPAKGQSFEDVERVQSARVQQSLSELVAEIKFGRSLMMSALFVTFLLCVSTFSMVVLATRYSSETVIVNGVMTDKASNEVVATAEHQEFIPEPLSLNSAQGVKRIIISKPDGTLITHRVESATRVSCKKASTSISIYCNDDGFAYLFDTARGTYAGTNGAAGVKFNLVAAQTADSLKELGAMRPKMSKATGKAL